MNLLRKLLSAFGFRFASKHERYVSAAHPHCVYLPSRLIPTFKAELPEVTAAKRKRARKLAVKMLAACKQRGMSATLDEQGRCWVVTASSCSKPFPFHY